MIYERKLSKVLKEHMENRQITVLTGMRRTGKTTLLKALLSEAPSSNTLFFDLENVVNRELFSEKNYDNIVPAFRQRGLNTNQKMYVAIDEIQLLPGIASVLKYLYDHHDIKFLVTGSSSYYLKHLFSESLSGRKAIFELFPLDFGEFLTFRGVSWSPTDFRRTKFSLPEYDRVRSYYEEFIRWGGFPEVVLQANEEEKKRLLNDIVSSYINVDIKTLADFRRDGDVYSIIKMLAMRAGTRLDYAKLSRLIGMSAPAVKEYVDFFEKTYLIARVPVMSRSADREIVKAKKLYFSDTGILNMLAEVGSGTQFENALFGQLRHTGDIRYYAQKSGKEIDFVLGTTLVLEAKETPDTNDQKTLRALSETIGVPEYRLVGRLSVPNFDDYIWGGDIR